MIHQGNAVETGDEAEEFVVTVLPGVELAGSIAPEWQQILTLDTYFEKRIG